RVGAYVMQKVIACVAGLMLVVQPAALEEADRAVYRAAFEAVVRPERERILAGPDPSRLC
ncbi:MAG TPA: hypothetical protein VMF13_14020, partial [Luteitalea sp.]|nr:hypothetical protein [Luteitalea sp.]